MFQIFELKDHEAVIPASIRTKKEFAPLFALKYNEGEEGDHDGRKRKKAYKVFKYMWYNFHPASPFAEYDKAKREEKSLKEAEISWKISYDPKAQKAIHYYVEDHLKKSRSNRALQTANNLVDKLIDHVDNLDMNQKDDHGRPIHDINKYSGWVEKLDTLIKGVAQLEKTVQEQQKTKLRAKGAAKIGKREDPR